MTIRHLRIFVAVYTARSMTEAAKKLYMTQPSVSQAIKELESHYDIRLFERLQHKLYPTSAADKLHSYAVKVLSLMECIDREINPVKFGKELRIGANYTVGAAMISDMIAELKEADSEVNVTVCINKATVLKEMLRRNELDLTLMEEQKKERDLVQEEFVEDRVAVVVSKDHPFAAKRSVTARAIASEKLLIRERGAGTRDQFEAAMGKKGYVIHPFWESISVTALKHAARDLLGVAVLPYESVKEEIKRKDLVELKVEGLELSRKLAIIYHKDKYITDTLHTFIEICHKKRQQAR